MFSKRVSRGSTVHVYSLVDRHRLVPSTNRLQHRTPRHLILKAIGTRESQGLVCHGDSLTCCVLVAERVFVLDRSRDNGKCTLSLGVPTSGVSSNRGCYVLLLNVFAGGVEPDRAMVPAAPLAAPIVHLPPQPVHPQAQPIRALGGYCNAHLYTGTYSSN